MFYYLRADSCITIFSFSSTGFCVGNCVDWTYTWWFSLGWNLLCYHWFFCCWLLKDHVLLLLTEFLLLGIYLKISAVKIRGSLYTDMQILTFTIYIHWMTIWFNFVMGGGLTLDQNVYAKSNLSEFPFWFWVFW